MTRRAVLFLASLALALPLQPAAYSAPDDIDAEASAAAYQTASGFAVVATCVVPSSRTATVLYNDQSRETSAPDCTPYVVSVTDGT